MQNKKWVITVSLHRVLEKFQRNRRQAYTRVHDKNSWYNMFSDNVFVYFMRQETNKEKNTWESMLLKEEPKKHFISTIFTHTYHNSTARFQFHSPRYWGWCIWYGARNHKLPLTVQPDLFSTFASSWKSCI